MINPRQLTLLATVTTLALAAPPPAAAPGPNEGPAAGAYNWGGFYVGVTAGEASTRNTVGEDARAPCSPLPQR